VRLSHVLLVLLSAVAGSPRSVYANPSPCRARSVAGRHVYVTAPQSDVQLQSERLRFDVQRLASFAALVVVNVDYVLDNRGQARDLVIGFPVSDIAVSAFRVDGDGVGERVVPKTGEAADWLEKAGLSECEELPPEPGEALGTYRWFLWQQKLRPGKSRLHVRYLLNWRESDLTQELVVDYVLRTARSWGNGRIGRLDIQLNDPARPRGLRWQARPKPTEVGNHGRRLLWSFEHYRPAHDLQLTLGPEREDL
jgi:hypothetical protein